MGEGPKEACGITAIFSKFGEDISKRLVLLQEKLQHRGRDSAGIAIYNLLTSDIALHSGLGKVTKVFPPFFNFEEHDLISDRGIGHNRYGTSGEGHKDTIEGVQPVLIEWGGKKVAIAYNGNLPNAQRDILVKRVPVDMPEGADFDTVDIARAIVSARGENWEERIKNALSGISLAYSLTILTDTGELFGLRGPTGTWPLWVGEEDSTIIFASETRVDPKMFWSEVQPGELIKASRKGVERKQLFERQPQFRCVLHDMYGALADSKMSDNKTYGDFRFEAGRILARRHPIQADIYAGIPQSGIPMAEGYASELGKKTTEFITIRDFDRGFMGRDETEINAVISGKYIIRSPEIIKNKSVFLVDDSIIRGKTLGGDTRYGVKGVIALVRESGASKISLGIALSRFVNSCDMGYYIRADQLVALSKKKDGFYESVSEEEIAKRIGADKVYYQPLDGVYEAYETILGEKDILCTRCLGGQHPLDILNSYRSTFKTVPIQPSQQPIVIFSASQIK